MGGTAVGGQGKTGASPLLSGPVGGGQKRLRDSSVEDSVGEWGEQEQVRVSSLVGSPAGGGEEPVRASSLVGGPAGGGQDQESVGASSRVGGPSGGGQELTGPPAQEEMFLADEERWENMNL